MESDNESEISLVGSVLEGAYRIERLIAKNEVGAVYEAFHLRLDKPVAIKVMAAELATSPEALERFRREALVTGGLGHPHIVQVFDHSITPTGEPFLAMELLDGEGLDRRLERVGRLPAPVTVHIVKQVASALAAAHAKEIVHRNLKPANICLLELAGETDFVKVLDFGVSKVRSAQVKLTKASMLIGTPNYMSPEQAMGQVEEIDHRSDQWALACIAWECLSGAPPFQADDIPTLLDRIVQEPLAPLGQPDLPPEIENVLRRALSKSKADRFPNMTVFSLALENALTAPPLVVEPARRAVAAPERRAPPPTAMLPESPVPAMAPVAASERRAPPPTAMLPESPVPAMPPMGIPERQHPSSPALSPPAGGKGIARKRPPVPARAGEPRHHPAHHPNVSPARPRWPWAVVAAAVLVLLLAAAFLLRPRTSEKPASAGANVPAPEKSPFTPPAAGAKPAGTEAEAEEAPLPSLAEPDSVSPPKPTSAEPATRKPAKHAGHHKAKQASRSSTASKPAGSRGPRPRLIQNLN
jgi:serine/threonine protein kinase